MLEVVEHQEQTLLPQMSAQHLIRALASGFPQPYRSRDGRDDEVWVHQRSQTDERYAVWEVFCSIPRRFQGKACLADAAQAGEGEQPDLPQEGPYLLQLPLPSQKGSRGHREVNLRSCCRCSGSSGAPRQGCQEGGACFFGELQRVRESPHGVRVGSLPLATLQGADSTGAQPRLQRQLLLRQTRGLPKAPQP